MDAVFRNIGIIVCGLGGGLLCLAIVGFLGWLACCAWVDFSDKFRAVCKAESYTTEELTCSYWKFAGGQENEHLKMDNLTLMGCEAEKAGLIEWKEVPREEKPTLYKAMEGIPGAEDAVLMRGTLRVLRKERG